MTCSACGQIAVSGQTSRPVWGPLLGVVGERLTGTFMWMQAIRLEDGTRIHAYKHTETRCYLYLSDAGEAYERLPCQSFLPLRLDYALEDEANETTVGHPRQLRGSGPTEDAGP